MKSKVYRALSVLCFVAAMMMVVPAAQAGGNNPPPKKPCRKVNGGCKGTCPPKTPKCEVVTALVLGVPSWTCACKK
jgi:hypothetical protein